MIKSKKIGMIAGVMMFISALSFSQDVFADYKVHFDKVHLTNYVQTMNDNFKTERMADGLYAIKDSGYYKIHDSGGRILSVNLKNGVLDGRYDEVYNNGNIFTSGNYVNGKKEGRWNIYAENGRLWKVYEYKNDQLNGSYVSYFVSSGIEETRGVYKNDLLDGDWIENYSSGNRKIYGKFANGKRNGTFTEWYSNGAKKSSMDFVDDNINGKVLAYYQNGRLFYEADMNGNAGSLKGYHSNGTLSFEGRIENHNRVGKWNYYDELGNVYNAIDYSNPVRMSSATLDNDNTNNFFQK